MRLERTQNTLKNILVSYLCKIVLFVFPFAIRRVFVHTLGSEYLGLNGLFSSILMALSLTELGFGSAIVVHMYHAIANENQEDINALLNYYRKVYYIVGIVILTIGCLLIPFIPRMINGDYPSNIDLTIIYLIYLFDTVVSYFTFAYYASLLAAFQMDYKVTGANTIARIVMYLIQLFLLFSTKNYYAYLVIMPLFTIVNNLLVFYFARKQLPNCRPEGNIEENERRDIILKVKGVMIGKVSAVFRNSFDSIFISMFLGLTMTAIYGNYFYILSVISNLLSVITGAATGGVGNSIALETQEKNHKDMNRMLFLYMWISGWCATCMMCLYQPFMSMWVGNEMLLPFSSMILFCIYLYSLKIGEVLSIYSGVCGLFWEKRFIAIIESVANIVLNYFLGKYFGIDGILWATIITIVLLNSIMGARIPYKYYFTDYKVSNYLMIQLRYACTWIATAIVTYYICFRIATNSNITDIIVRSIICIVVPNGIYWLIYHRTAEYRDSIPWIKERVKLIVDKIKKLALI